MITRYYIFALFISLQACSSVDVAKELKIVDDSMQNTASAVFSEIRSDLDDEKKQEPGIAANNNDTWTASDACSSIKALETTVKLSECTIIKTSFENLAPPVGNAHAVQRKMNGLQEYIATLTLLASSETEEEIVTALAALVASTEKLNKNVSSSSLSGLVKKLKKNQNTIGKVASFAVENLRVQQMRKIVKEANRSFQTVISEVKEHLITLNADKKFIELQEHLSAADYKASEAIITGDADVMEKAFKNLDEKHKTFVAHAKTSIYVKLNLLAQAHNALAGRLADNPKIEEVITFLESVKDLSDSLGV